MTNAFPNINPYLLSASLQVNVVDGNGAPISGGDLTTLAAGSPLSVEVVFLFDTARWMRGFDYLDSQYLRSTTIARRE